MRRSVLLLTVGLLLCILLAASADATEVNPCSVEICSFGDVAVELYVADSCEQNAVAGRGFMLMESYFAGNYLNVLWGEFNTAFEWTDYRLVDFNRDGVDEVVTLTSEESVLWADVHSFSYVDSQLVWEMYSIPVELTYWLDDVTSIEFEGDSLVVYGFQYTDELEERIDKLIVIRAADGLIEYYGAYLKE